MVHLLEGWVNDRVQGMSAGPLTAPGPREAGRRVIGQGCMRKVPYVGVYGTIEADGEMGQQGYLTEP